jgi:hypothetical protein
VISAIRCRRTYRILACFGSQNRGQGERFPLDAAAELIIIAPRFSYDASEMLMRSLAMLGAAIVAALLLSACNETAQPVAAAPPGPPGASAAAVLGGLPQGAPCTEAIGRYHTVVQHDADTGNVNQSVYHQIEDEISRAAAACAAGHGGEAISLIQGSKARHGYHA